MKLLQELMVLGDENVLGGMIHNAIINLNKLKKQKELNGVCLDVLSQLDNIQQDPNMLVRDNFTMTKYLSLLTNPNISIQSLEDVRTAFSSYDDSDGD